jgi:hypothetical protein
MSKEELARMSGCGGGMIYCRGLGDSHRGFNIDPSVCFRQTEKGRRSVKKDVKEAFVKIVEVCQPPYRR